MKVMLLFFHIIAIFLLNDVLFDSQYWGDQSRYVGIAKTTRERLVSFQDFSVSGPLRLVIPGYLFAFSPMPFINSVQSIAMINFMIYFSTLIFLKKKRISSTFIDYFFLLYPSLLLYSSLALRDTLITFIMIVGFYYLLIKEKMIVSILCFLPLAIIKIQNFLIILLSYMLYFFLRKRSIKRYALFIVTSIFFIFYGNQLPVINFLITRLNYYRYNLLAENFGYNWDFMENFDYQPFEAGFSMIPLMFKSFFYMLFKPFPWEIGNVVQLIQSVENILIIGLIIWIASYRVKSNKIKQKLLLMNIFLIISMTIYGLVTVNFGTAARFRFPFIVIYFVYYLYLLKCDKINSKMSFSNHVIGSNIL